MRIFQVLEFNQFNTGSVHQIFQAALGLRERGHDVTIVSRGGSVLEQLPEELAGYAKTVSALHFPIDRPLAEPLVRKLIEVRLSEVTRI